MAELQQRTAELQASLEISLERDGSWFCELALPSRDCYAASGDSLEEASRTLVERVAFL
jgi:hypothetical protein